MAAAISALVRDVIHDEISATISSDNNVASMGDSIYSQRLVSVINQMHDAAHDEVSAAIPLLPQLRCLQQFSTGQ